MKQLKILSYLKKIMIVKKILLMMRRNSMTLLGAAILASGIFYVVNNPESFTASILSLQEQEFIAEKGWDMAYKTNSGYVDIFMAETLDTPASIDLTVSFDKDTITIDPAVISGQWMWTFSTPDDSSIIIQSLPNEDIIKTESVIMLPFTGDIEDILLSEAVAKSIDGTSKALSIGSLNGVVSHSNTK